MVRLLAVLASVLIVAGACDTSALPAASPTISASPSSPATPAPAATPSTPPTSPSPTSTSSPTPSTSPSPTPNTAPRTPEPTNPAPIPGVVAPWTESADAGLGRVYDIVGTASANGTHVIVGTAEILYWYVFPGKTGWMDDLVPAIWYSPDARTWQQADLPAEPELWDMIAVVAVDGGFVAFAYVDTDDASVTSAFTSSDGQEWQFSGSFVGSGRLIGTAGDRLVVFGETEYGQPAAVWVSDDGATWQSVTEESALEVAGGVVALLSHDGFLWAVRSDDPYEDASIKTPVELWRTSDGLAWEMVGLLPKSISVNSASMAVGPAGWVITASRVTSAPGPGCGPGQSNYSRYAWHSADGLSWKVARSAPEHVEQVVADESGFIGIGRRYAGGGCVINESDVRQTVWVSSDGSSWQQLPRKGWHGREIDVVSLLGDEVVAVGIDWKLLSGGDEPGDMEGGWGVVWTVDRAELAGGRRGTGNAGGGIC